MNQKALAELTDEELLKTAKTLKSTKIYDALIVGFLAGVAIYSSVNNGFGILTFLPLFYLAIAAKNTTKRNEVKKLLKERNLE